MKAIKLLGIALGVYLGLVVAFESLVVIMGKRQADGGVQPGENWLVITTTDADGSNDTVVAGVENGGHLYVAANHWPRGWYNRAIKNPDVAITRAGERWPIAQYRSPGKSAPVSPGTTAFLGQFAS